MWGRKACALGRPSNAPRQAQRHPGFPSTPGPRRSGALPTHDSCPGRAATARRPAAHRGRSSGAESVRHCGRASTPHGRPRRGAAAAAKGAPKPEAAALPAPEPHPPPPRKWAKLSPSPSPKRPPQVPGFQYTYPPATAVSHIRETAEPLLSPLANEDYVKKSSFRHLTT